MIDYNDFNIIKFNELIQKGDIYALEYIGETIIDKMQKDPFKLDKAGLFSNLYNATLSLNTCVVTLEQCNNVTQKSDVFEIYTKTRDLLFEELGIIYNSIDYKYYYITIKK